MSVCWTDNKIPSSLLTLKMILGFHLLHCDQRVESLTSLCIQFRMETQLNNIYHLQCK